MLWGGAKVVGFHAVFDKGFLSVGLFVDEDFHADGDEWHSNIVMGAIEAGICRDCRVCV